MIFHRTVREFLYNAYVIATVDNPPLLTLQVNSREIEPSGKFQLWLTIFQFTSEVENASVHMLIFENGHANIKKNFL